MLMNIFPLVLIGLLFLPDMRKRNENESYISKDTALCMKGFSALAVILHHMSQRTRVSGLYAAFLVTGVFSVSCFLFHSGYGLMKNCMEKPDYEKGFLKRRLLPVAPVYVPVSILYWLVYKILGTDYGIGDFTDKLMAGDPIQLFSWYVFFIMIFYIVFDLLMIITKKNRKGMLIGMAVFCILWCAFCMSIHFGIWWYNTAHIGLMGMVWYAYEEKIMAVMNRHRKAVLSVSGLICVSLAAVPYIVPFVYQLPLYMLITIAFVAAMNGILMKYRPLNPVLRFFGKISYELYLVHGLFVILFREGQPLIASDFLYVCAVYACSLILAWIVHGLNRKAVEFIS